MPLPTSGSLSLSQVRTEFGAPTTTPLSAFLRGGAWVPNTAVNAGVPTALPISLRQLLGASKEHEVSAPDISSFVLIGQTAQASSTATVTGGVGPFTYSWAWVTGGVGVTLFGTTTATVTASRNSTSAGSSGGTLRVSVTDTGNGDLVRTDDILVTLETSG